MDRSGADVTRSHGRRLVARLAPRLAQAIVRKRDAGRRNGAGRMGRELWAVNYRSSSAAFFTIAGGV